MEINYSIEKRETVKKLYFLLCLYLKIVDSLSFLTKVNNEFWKIQRDTWAPEQQVALKEEST